jgi:hypothetical protein
MRKIISIIVITATIFSLSVGVFLYKSQKAQAGIIPDPMNFLKEFILDVLLKPVAHHMMTRLQQEIGRWAQGGFSDENKPFAMTSWKDELKGIANVAGGRMVSEFGLTPLCAPIKVSLGSALGLDSALMAQNTAYTEYAACTIQNVVDNVEAFYENPSISVYGWDSWTALTQPNNNFLGSALMALQRREEITQEETDAKAKEIEAGQGVKNEVICTETDEEKCLANCPNQVTCESDCSASYVNCMADLNNDAGVCAQREATCMGNCDCEKKCAKSSSGVCLKEVPK